MPPSFEIRWVETPTALAEACEALADADWLAVDTEFHRESTFFPIAALVQLYAGGDEAFLIDPQVVAADSALQALLGADGPLKLLHASGEDLEVLESWADVAVAPIADTQVAQSLLSTQASLGYQRLVEQWTGDVLPKEETRSDWLQRPLSDSQLRYAALDVVYLPLVWQAQRDALVQQGRLAWLEEECTRLCEANRRNRDADEQWYRRHRQLWRLEPRQLALYQALTRWREGEVRLRDLPRGWLASDKVLFAIAVEMPHNRYQLSTVEGVRPKLIKHDGDTLLAMVQEADHLDDDALPAPLPPPHSAAFKTRLKALKSVVNREAERLDIAPEVLANRRDLEALVMADLDGVPLSLPQGWRGTLLGDAFTQALADY
ncbi:ribonuclease D [Chromohalobacter japonicus]|uniref:ribonuclease D n=1 Tax=Chromohalobacter japonicus TaxID=223900 RepID=UPI00058FDD60|nr:ribonuclease D [Chromohalobacter japonicus]